MVSLGLKPKSLLGSSNPNLKAGVGNIGVLATGEKYSQPHGFSLGLTIREDFGL